MGENIQKRRDGNLLQSVQLNMTEVLKKTEDSIQKLTQGHQLHGREYMATVFCCHLRDSREETAQKQ